MLLKGFINNNRQQWTALSAQSCHSLGMNFSEANNRKWPTAELEKIEGKLLRVVMIQPSTRFIPVLEKRAERANLLVLPPFPALVDHDRSIARTRGSTKMESMQQQPASSK